MWLQPLPGIALQLWMSEARRAGRVRLRSAMPMRRHVRPRQTVGALAAVRERGSFGCRATSEIPRDLADLFNAKVRVIDPFVAPR